MDELKVMDLLRTFQRYFFMEAGDWAEHLTEALCTAQHDVLHEHSVQSMVDNSFKGSSVEQDPAAAQLKVSLQTPSHALPRQAASSSRASPGQAGAFPEQAGSPSKQERGNTGQAPLSSISRTASVKVDNSQLRAFEAVRLSYEIAWPLSLVVTQVSHVINLCT